MQRLGAALIEAQDSLDSPGSMPCSNTALDWFGASLGRHISNDVSGALKYLLQYIHDYNTTPKIHQRVQKREILERDALGVMKHQNQNNLRQTGLDMNRLVKRKADVEESQETPLTPWLDSICARERGVRDAPQNRHSSLDESLDIIASVEIHTREVNLPVKARVANAGQSSMLDIVVAPQLQKSKYLKPR